MGRTKFWSIKNTTSLYLSLLMRICHYNTRGAGSVAKTVAGSDENTVAGNVAKTGAGSNPSTMLLCLHQLLFALWRMLHTPLIGVVTHATPTKAFFLINERFVECAGITFSRFAKVKYGIVGIILVQYAVKQGINRTKMLPL